MTSELISHAGFYASARGAVAARVLREHLAALWPDLSGQAVLGIGYVGPYLRLWQTGAARCIAAIPAQLEVAAWPGGAAPNLSLRIEDDRLPFGDLSFDRILLVHGLEAAQNPRRLLREVWRVLRDDGCLLVVAPNRLGLWAHVEATPFGHGHPYSEAQLAALLQASLFRVERRAAALFVPPTKLRAVLKTHPLWEQAGLALIPTLAGLMIAEAVKDTYAAIPIQLRARRVVVESEAI